MSKFIILQLSGFGDTLSAITRLPAVKEKYPEHEIVFYIGGYGKSVQFSKEQIEREGYKVNIINNFNFHNQIPRMKQFLIDNVVKEGDILEDWSFCEEIFSNKDPIFYQYDMVYPYIYKTTKNPYDDRKDHTPDRTIAIHPLTKSGNAEGFESDIDKGRFWNRDEWKKLCVKLCDSGYTPAFVGYGDEDWGLIDELTEEGYNILDKRMNVEDTIYFLQTVNAGIFCNSWDWEVTSRAGIPTFCFYTKNHFFIQNHVPHGPSDFWNTCYIETNNVVEDIEGSLENNNSLTMKGVSFVEVFDKINYIIENKSSPSYPYTLCMIGMDNEDYIQRTYDNIVNYIGNNKENQFVMIDGGSKDSTNQITERFIKETGLPEDNCSLIYNEWPNDHSVQKNKSIEQAKNKWVVWLDTDETYEEIFWNQIGWYIRDAENNNLDSICFPRINTLDGNLGDIEDLVNKKKWRLTRPFMWINYPDIQQRVFQSNLRFSNKVHIRLNNTKGELYIPSVHCIHNKKLSKQVEQLKEYGEYV